MVLLIFIFLAIILFLFLFEKNSPDNVKAPIPNKVEFEPLLNSEALIEPKDEKRKIISDFDRWKDKQLNVLGDYDSLIDLLKTTEIKSIRYWDLLGCFEWKVLRFRIQIRDSFACKDCGKKDLLNHVHHELYLKDFLPWEIENHRLTTLCKDCHRTRHEKETIRVFEKIGNNLREIGHSNLFCPRCKGTNYLPQFKNVQNGICFLCFGDTVRKSVFDKRLLDIKRSPEEYNINQIFEDLFKFTESISEDYFQEKISGTLYLQFKTLYPPSIPKKYLPKQPLEIQKKKLNNNSLVDDDDDPPF